MSSKALNIAIILTAYDKATRVINDAVGKADKKMRELKKSSQDAFGTGLAQMGAGLALAAPLVDATQAAISFEDKMADVAKVMNLTVGSGEFKEMSDQAKDLAKYLGKTGVEASGLMANLAAGGVEKNDMAAVAKIAGEMGVAFNMASDQAGTSFIKIKNALGVTIPEAKKVGDAINYLSDSMASEANEIVTFMASGGSSVAAGFKVAGKDAAAFGSTLISLGKSSSESATIFERFAKGIFKNADMKKIFDQAGGGASGMVAVLDKGVKSKNPFEFFRKFGEYGSDIQLLATRSGLLKDALKGVSNEMNYSNSVSKEFANRNSTTQGKINKLKASFDVLKIQLGETFLPLLVKVSGFLLRVANRIGEWAKENPRLAKTLMFAGAAVAGFLLLAGAFNIVRGAFMMMRVVFMTNPVGLILMAIAAIAAIIISNWDKIGPFFARLWARVKQIFSAVWNWIRNNLLYVFAPSLLIYKHWDKITEFFGNLWENVKGLFKRFLKWVIDLHVKFFEAGKNIVNAIGQGIEDAAQKLLDKVKKLAKDIRDFFPFSPAKTGPLRDIHKIKLVETIAASIKPGPLVSAVNRVAGATAGSFGGAIPSMGGGAGSVVYSPTINFTGGMSSGSKVEFSAMLRQHADEIMRMIKNENDKKARLSY